ncbi:plasmid mobilization protein, partial [Campylobacter jejuni]
MKTLTKRLRLSQDEWEQIQIKLKESELNFSSFALKSMLKQKSLKRKQTPINRDFIA